MNRNLYELDVPSPSDSALVACSTELWHRRLAHIDSATISEMAKSGTVRDLKFKILTTQIARAQDASEARVIERQCQRNPILVQSRG